MAEVVDEQTAEGGSEEVQWATPESLPTQGWKAVTLPVLGKKVRVRYLGQTEVARIGYLPEMREFGEIMAEQILNAPQDDEPDQVMARLEQLEIERAKYCALVTHMCVMAGEDERPVRCEECGLPHAPSLWTRAQAELLELIDLRMIVDAAERQEELRQIVPFSEAPEPDTQPAASTSESTPEQTS